MRGLLVISKFLPEYTGAALRIDATYRRIQKLHDDITWSVICSGIEYRDSAQYQHNGVDVTRIKSLTRPKKQTSAIFNIFAAYKRALNT